MGRPTRKRNPIPRRSKRCPMIWRPAKLMICRTTASALFVRIYNNTGERLKVWVQVVSDGEANKEKEPDPKKIETLSYDLATGKAYDLPHNGERSFRPDLQQYRRAPEGLGPGGFGWGGQQGK